MFRCQKCGTVVPPRTKAARVVVRTRFVKFPPRPEANRVVRTTPIEHKRKIRLVDDPGGRGQQIAREILVCPDCARVV